MGQSLHSLGSKLSPMRIAFRTDSSLRIGTGHLMRCLTLADELAGRGHDLLFICRELEGNLNALVRDRGHKLKVLPAPPSPGGATADENATTHAAWLAVSQDADAKQTAAALARVNGEKLDWLIVDHYALDVRWEAHLRSCGVRLMAIDDLADRPHACDLLLDQNLYAGMESRYQGLVSETCRTLLGPRFALLRPEFAQAAKELPTRTGEVRRVLVFFGGVDAENATTKALEALSLVADPRISIDVIIGQSNPHQELLRRYCKGRLELRLHVQTERIAELMAAADLAIGGGGVATWERCALGLPAIVWPLADNQRPVIAAIADYGAVYTPDPETVANPEHLSRHLFALINCAQLRRHLGTRATSLCDGNGTNRVADLIAPTTVDLRPATVDDCDNTYRWRNHAETRRASIDSEAIPYRSHRTWFERALADPDRILLIAEREDSPVGVLRYDLDCDGAMVSLYVIPGLSGKGIGGAMLQAGEAWLIRNHPDVERMHAVVLEANTPSRAVFEKCGFSRHHIVYEKALTK